MKGINRWLIICMSVFFLSLSLWSIWGKTPDYSESERRVLASFPEVEIDAILSGEFSEDFDKYAVERFPARDVWRSIKAYTQTKVLGQKDNNGIYAVGSQISKMEYPMNQEMADYAVQLFDKVREMYLTDNNIYLAIIPDKNRYLAEESGHLSIDYDAFSSYVKEKTSYAEYIEIADLLEAEDYYATDTHWKQEKILDVAERLADSMGAELTQKYETHQLEMPFEGVYVGQSALLCEPDTIQYLSNDVIEQVDLDGAKAVYDMEKAYGRDPYEMFLSGNQPVITIKNPQNTSGKRLILFRDSFGSSIAPLLIEGYAEMVLVDLRYISSAQLGDYVDFENADVLFLYSTMMLNNSKAMK